MISLLSFYPEIVLQRLTILRSFLFLFHFYYLFFFLYLSLSLSCFVYFILSILYIECRSCLFILDNSYFQATLFSHYLFPFYFFITSFICITGHKGENTFSLMYFAYLYMRISFFITFTV